MRPVLVTALVSGPSFDEAILSMSGPGTDDCTVELLVDEDVVSAPLAVSDGGPPLARAIVEELDRGLTAALLDIRVCGRSWELPRAALQELLQTVNEERTASEGWAPPASDGPAN